jgi:SAM-dependent methyltransferase
VLVGSIKSLSQYYEERAGIDQEGRELYQATDLVKALFRRRLGAVGRFLDIGCGIGHGTLAVGQALGAREIFGVDFTASYLKAASSLGIHAIQVDLNTSSLPFPDNSFEAILCSEVIEHLFDSGNLLRETNRVLAPDGLCVLTTPNLASWLDRCALFFFGWQPFSTSTSFAYDVGRPRFLSNRTTGKHIRVLTYRALIELLTLHKFSIVDVRGARTFTNFSLARVPDYIVRWRGLLQVVRGFLVFCAYSIDWLISRSPRLATGIVVGIKKVV